VYFYIQLVKKFQLNPSWLDSMSICDLFVVIVMYIFVSFYHVWEITFFGIYKATDKLDSNLINTKCCCK